MIVLVINGVWHIYWIGLRSAFIWCQLVDRRLRNISWMNLKGRAVSQPHILPEVNSQMAGSKGVQINFVTKKGPIASIFFTQRFCLWSVARHDFWVRTLKKGVNELRPVFIAYLFARFYYQQQWILHFCTAVSLKNLRKQHVGIQRHT